MGDEDAGRHALLFHRCDIGFGNATPLAFLDESREFGIVLRSVGGERMLGGDGDEGHAHDRVGARGEYPELLSLAVELIGESETHALALADPVLLHQLDLLRPAFQFVQIGQQLLCVGRNLHVVHRDFTLLDQRARTPTASVDHLLVGQHRLIDRIPVNRTETLVNQALFVETGK